MWLLSLHFKILLFGNIESVESGHRWSYTEAERDENRSQNPQISNLSVLWDCKLDSIASMYGTPYTRTFSPQTTQLQIDKDCDLLNLK